MFCQVSLCDRHHKVFAMQDLCQRRGWHTICNRAVELLGIQKIIDKHIDIFFAPVLVFISEKVNSAKLTNFRVATADKSSDQVPPVHVKVLDIVSEDGWLQHGNSLSAIITPVKHPILENTLCKNHASAPAGTLFAR